MDHSYNDTYNSYVPDRMILIYPTYCNMEGEIYRERQSQEEDDKDKKEDMRAWERQRKLIYCKE